MRPLRELTLIVLVIGGALVASQVPRFVQEYQQRLGGALQVAQANAERDEGLAQARGAPLPEYLRQLEAEGPLAREQAEGIRTRQLEFIALRRQAEELAAASRLMRPVILARVYDRRLFDATWAQFEPNLTFDIAFGLIGIAIGWLLNALIWLPFGGERRYA